MINSFILFVFLATFFWSITILIDRELVYNRFEDPILAFLCSFVFGSFFILPIIILFIGFNWIGLRNLIMVFPVTVSYFLGYYFYFKSAQKLNPSTISVLIKLSTIIVLFYGIFVLKNSHSFTTYLGIGIVLLATFLSSIDNNLRISNLTGVFYILLSSVLFSIMIIFQKYLVSNIFDPYVLYSWQYMTTLLIIFVSVFFTGYRKKVYNTLVHRNYKMPAFSQTFNELGEIFWLLSLSIGSVSIATVISSTTTVIVFVFSVIIAKLIGSKEWQTYGRKSLIKNSVSVIFLVLGFSLIFIL